MALSVEGPLRGLFLWKLPPNSTVHVIDNKDSILLQPFGKEAKTVTTSDRSSHVFLQSGGRFYLRREAGSVCVTFSGENQQADVLRLSVNGREATLPAKIDAGNLSNCQPLNVFCSLPN